MEERERSLDSPLVSKVPYLVMVCGYRYLYFSICRVFLNGTVRDVCSHYGYCSREDIFEQSELCDMMST